MDVVDSRDAALSSEHTGQLEQFCSRSVSAASVPLQKG